MPDQQRPDIEGLYREHRARLVRLVERELHDRHEAEDVVQTAFLDAQRALKRGTTPHNPRAWLAAIALNAARRLRRRRVSVEALEEYAAHEASRLPEITAALAGLPRNEQAAVLYRDVLGLSYAEMAEHMGTTVPAVTMLLHRARSRLRSVLGIAVAGFGLWRWLRSGAWQATAAKAAGVAVLASGLATAGVVTGRHAARATAPPAAGTAPAPTQPGREAADVETKVGVMRKRANRPEHGSSTARVHTEQNPTATAAPVTAVAPTTPVPTAEQPVPSKAPVAASSVPSQPLLMLSVPTLSTPALTLPTPTLPTTVATVATVATPMATVTVALPPATTATLTTPIATVTVSVP